MYFIPEQNSGAAGAAAREQEDDQDIPVDVDAEKLSRDRVRRASPDPEPELRVVDQNVQKNDGRKRNDDGKYIENADVDPPEPERLKRQDLREIFEFRSDQNDDEVLVRRRQAHRRDHQEHGRRVVAADVTIEELFVDETDDRRSGRGKAREATKGNFAVTTDMTAIYAPSIFGDLSVRPVREPGADCR